MQVVQSKTGLPSQKGIGRAGAPCIHVRLHEVPFKGQGQTLNAPVEGIGESEEGDVGPQQVAGHGLDAVEPLGQHHGRHQHGCT